MMKKALVINLTRFGDILQSQPVVSRLHNQGYTVGFVCLDCFEQVPRLLNFVDEVFPLPAGKFLAGLEKHWASPLEAYWNWTHGVLDEFGAELVVNLTFTLPARLLQKSINAPFKTGFCLDEKGFSANSSRWCAFLTAAAHNRRNSPLNLVDLMSRVERGEAGGSADLKRPAPELCQKMREQFFAGLEETPRGFVGFQLGASNARRQWPVQSFLQVAEELWEKYSLCPVLLGSGGERELAQTFCQQSQIPVVNCVGETSLTELGAMLSMLELLVTNDTGTMHYAAGLGVKVCALFLSTAQPWDTGPYRAGAVCLEPNMECHPCHISYECTEDFLCHKILSPEHVLAYAEQLLGDSRRLESMDASRLKQVRAWETIEDGNGFIDLRSLNGLEETDRTAWRRMQRQVYRQFLDETGGAHEPLNLHGLSQEKSQEIGTELEQAWQRFFLLEQEMKILLQRPVEALKQKVMMNYERVTSELLQSAHFHVLGALWQEESQFFAASPENFLQVTLRYRKVLEVWKTVLLSNGMQLETL
ncbi:glycosyltransferase family 9 protein [Desulfobaculum bizertense]|uniref:glycosyltransferase family 9 protein n=1 Tax=Desulfobaculum bizertense TaxID=376490 RepID=UPI001F47BE92|nr:glycosyltransferase family 9 protein [Desulfobaculum bizertense]UIJ39347.1 glycosyltransferase family 9 protein [Desulfobaculum bizertense]